MSKIKKSLFKYLYKAFTEPMIEFFFMLVFIAILCWVLKLNIWKLFSKIDLTVFIAIIIAFIVNVSTNLISKYFRKKIEDVIKLSDDYEILIKQYPCQEMISYNNKQEPNIKLFRKIIKENNKNPIKIPVILEQLLIETNINVIDSKDKQYKLPEIIKDNYETIMKAHEFSDVYNQLNIRLDNYKFNSEKNLLTLETSRTTYFDSLVTNRAMDYKWGLKSSNRELLDYGPYVHSLSESKLSNHLGFNGFVETSDGKIIFVQRNNDVSIGKGTLGNSIGASLKTMYALDDNKNFTEAMLINSMEKELEDELSIPNNCYEFSSKNIIAIYRDLVEGGKPQLLFYVKIKKSSEEIKELFDNDNKKKNKKYLQSKLKKDGNKLIFIDINKLGEILIFPELIIYNKKQYLTMPSASAAIVILIKYFKEKKKEVNTSENN